MRKKRQLLDDDTYTHMYMYMVPEEPGGVHAKEAAEHHQKGGESGESYKVVVRERYIQWAFFRDKKLYQWRDSLT